MAHDRLSSFRFSELVLVPNLLSLLRLPLAICFWLLIHRPLLALLVLLCAGITDVLDGWFARTYGQATATGAVLDPVTDKIFVVAVVLTLLADGRLSWQSVPLLALREVGELPLVIWWLFNQRRRQERAQHPMANLPGKLATLLQFVTVGAALMLPSATSTLLVATAVTGAAAAFTYWRRELAQVRPRTDSHRR